MVGAGVGSRRGVNWRIIGGMVLAWVVTLPSTAAIAWLALELTRLPSPINILTVGLVVLGLGSWIVWAMRHSMGHRELEAELATTPDALLAPVKPAV